MAFTGWSTAAGENNSASPNGFPEGMAPSGVNDAARQIMADLKTSMAPTVATIAALKAIDVSAANKVSAYVNVARYYAANYGGGGLFYWDSSSSSTDDGGAVIRPDSAPASGRWIRIFDQVRVRYFGAKGDGIADDGPFFQKSIDYINTKGGGVLVVEGGEYLIETQFNVCNDLSIIGHGATLVAGRSWAHIDAPMIKNFTATKMSVAPGTITATRNVRIYGIEFNGNDIGGAAGVANASMHGIFVCMGNRTDTTSAVNGFAVKDCYFHDFDGAGVLTYGGKNIDVSGNLFVNHYPNVSLSIGSGLQLTDVDGFIVSNNLFDHTGSNWSWHGMTILDFNSKSKNGTVSNNTIRNMNNGDGISCEGNAVDNLENVTFTGNSIRSCAGDGIGVDRCYQVSLIGNILQNITGIGFNIGQTERLIISGNSLTTIGSTAIYGSGDRIIISGNMITGTTYLSSTYQGDAILLSPTVAGTANSSEIFGNYIKDIAGAGVSVAENSIISGNFFYDCGSSASSTRRHCVVGDTTSVIVGNIFRSIGNTSRAVSCASPPPTLRDNQFLGTFSDCKVFIGFRGAVSTTLSLSQSRIESDGPSDNITIWDTTTPGAGYWLRGDIVNNKEPSTAGYIGWVCVTTPSVWKTFGPISA